MSREIADRDPVTVDEKLERLDDDVADEESAQRLPVAFRAIQLMTPRPMSVAPT